ncbi:MAG: hypothetical protein Q9190_001205 [Brigantiaea leucoxantha]
MFHSRRLISVLPRRACPSRPFSRSAAAFVKLGDPLPDVDLVEGSPGNKVNLSKELQGKGLVIGVPAAFSPACSATHIPGYVNSSALKDAGQVFVVSVNDPFVMKAWGSTLDPQGKSGVSKRSISIRFVGDPAGSFTEALDLSFDSATVFGNNRSKRYALVIKDGKVEQAHVEPDNTGVNGKYYNCSLDDR